MTQIEEKENDPMPDFVDGPKLSQRLAAALRDAKDVRLAVAFWGAGAAEELCIHVGVGARFRVVCNLSSGGTNPHEIRELRKRGVEVRQLNDLHAKIGVVDDLSFLGSSNMSTNGLGGEYTRTGWREANIVYQNARPEIASMFDDFWRNGTEINDADLKNAEAAWDVRSKGIAIIEVRNKSLVDILRSAPNRLDTLNVRMVVYEEITDPEEGAQFESAQEEATRRYGESFDVYYDWKSMKKKALDAYLVDYYWPASGSIAGGTLYRRDVKNFPDIKVNGEKYCVCFGIDNIEGITFPKEDNAAIRKAFHKYVGAGNKNKYPENKSEYPDQLSYNFPISELAPYLPSDR